MIVLQNLPNENNALTETGGDWTMVYNGGMLFPQVRLAASAAKRVRHFDCWVFRDELLPPALSIPDGDIVELLDRNGTFLGYAFYSGRSHVAARVLSLDRDQPPNRAWLAERLSRAIAARAGVPETNAKRLVFSEADGLPGLIVDQYADTLVMQSRTAGIEHWKSLIVELLQDAVHPAGILERSDKEFREEEGLPIVTQVLAGRVPERVPIEDDGLRFLVDPHHGHKTGFYLDQRDTRRWIGEHVRDGQRVLDAFAYTGAFGIGAATRGARVVCLEQQEGFVALAKEQAELNRVSDRMEFVIGDAFYWLEAAASRGDRFDWVLLDPPSLAKSKADVPKARRALHHLLVNGLRLVSPGGTLALSVCTYHLLGLAEEILRIAAEECGVRLWVRAVTRQAADHPWVLQMPMTHYLMTWIVQCEKR